MSSEWFDAGSQFHNGWAKIEKTGNKHNFINTKGELFSKEWATNTWDSIEMREKVWGTFDEYDDAIIYDPRVMKLKRNYAR